MIEGNFPAKPHPGQVVFGAYRLLRVGRKRPSGIQLFQAEDIASTRLVAIKRQPLQTGMLEAALLQRLDHPGIARFIRHTVTPTHSFLVQEWVEGERLEAFKRALPLAGVLVLGQQLAAVLAYLHRHRIIHGDLDGQNVLRGQGNRLVVIDFGLAQVFPPGDADFTDWQHVEIGISRKLLASLLQPTTSRDLRRMLLTAHAPSETASDLLATLRELASF